jgi:hypothetical protein
MINEKCCSQLSTYLAFREADESLSVQTKLDSLFKPASLRSETSTASESSVDGYMCRGFVVFH